MSRARAWTDPRTGETHWFNVYAPATADQLELLADIEGIEIDDILEEDLSQRVVKFRLDSYSNVIPADVLERKRERAQERHIQPVCRICPAEGKRCEGRITRHHFVPRWMMLELENYSAYSPRSFCTIPVCVGRHRDLHFRGDDVIPKSIVPYLTESEKDLAEKLLSSLKDERPILYDLIASGDRNSYEWQLIRDWQLGHFYRSKDQKELSSAMDLETAVGGGE